MRQKSSKDILRRLEHEGWYPARVKGSHHQYKHDSKSGRVTVPHPKANIYGDTLRSIYRQAGWEW